MSLIIVGMNKPNRCIDCKLCVTTEDGFGGFLYFKCLVLNKSVSEFCTDRCSYECPIVEIPAPHGRLIDADSLECDSEYDDGEFWAVSMVQIENTQTIIEAEGI